jgi:hypothetical protein
MRADAPPLYLHCLRSGAHLPTHIGAVCPEMLAAQLDFRPPPPATPPRPMRVVTPLSDDAAASAPTSLGSSTPESPGPPSRVLLPPLTPMAATPRAVDRPVAVGEPVSDGDRWSGGGDESVGADVDSEFADA